MFTMRNVTWASVVIIATLLACGGLEAPSSTAPPESAPMTTAAAPRPQDTPTSMDSSSHIAFASNRDGNWEIYQMNADGTNPVRLTTSPKTEEYFPHFSPDGTWLLYWSYVKEPLIAELHWFRAGSDGVFATNVQPYVSFSPDGRLVVFCTNSAPGNIDIFGIAAGGGDSAQLTSSPGRDYEPAWSPDGKTIAFVSDRDGMPHIYLMDPDGGNQRRLTRNDISEMEPAWSPDGKTIAFLGDISDASSNIHLVNADGTNTRRLTNAAGSYNENPVWSPDGSMIAFWSNRTGNSEIFVMRLDGTGLTNLTGNPAEDQNPSWSG